MASLVDDSISSVAHEQLAQLRERLLEPEALHATTTSQANGVARNHASIQDGTSYVAESANAHNTPRVPPRFPTSKSASAVEMEALVNPSPSQEAFTAMTRASSFHGYPAGDTQPLESQVYKDFNASIIKSMATPQKYSVMGMPDVRNDTYDTMATEKTARTCEEGDTGYVDLEHALSPTAPSVSSQFDDLSPTSPTSELAAEDFAFVRPALPETPHIAGRKRSRSGEILTSATTAQKQPAFSQLFGGGDHGPLMSTTQLFNQTQAPSSPPPDAPRSDPVITRPSPNLQTQFDTSPPRFAFSSPTATSRPATAGGPRDNYRPMHESQQRRATSLQAEIGPSSDLDDHFSDEEDAVQRRFENKRMHRVVSDRALQGLAKLSAPSSRPLSRLASSPRRRNTVDLVTPSTTRKDVIADWEVSDDEDEEGPVLQNEEDDIVIIEDETLGTDQNSEDEYDEFGQEVLRSQGPGEEEDEDENNHADLEEEQLERGDGAMDGGPQNEKDEAPVPPMTQRSAIADSQPFQQKPSRSLLPAALEESSSVPSYIPGSQYTGRTSQEQAHLPANTPQKSPRAIASSTNANGGVVPSSPPLAAAGNVVDGGAVVASTASDPNLPALPTNVSAVQEVPESDLPDFTVHPTNSSDPNTSNEQPQNNSNNTNPAIFSTAQTHLSRARSPEKTLGLPVSPMKILASQQSKIASQSPMTKAGVRRFADLSAVNSPPPDGSGQTLRYIEEVMGAAVTEEDRMFMEVVEGEVESRGMKRRKLGRDESSGVVEAAPEVLEEGEEEVVDEREIEEMRVLDDAGVVPESSSLPQDKEQAAEAPSAMPDSVIERQNAGAKAVSQLLSRRSSAKSKTYSRKNSRNTRPTKLSNAARAASAEKQSKGHHVKAIDPKVQHQAEDEPFTSSRGDHENSVRPDVENGDTIANDLARANESGIVAPNRVFALFRGNYNGFYPATWLGSSADGLMHRVRFDDLTPASIDAHLVCALDLRIGDQVKVDVNGMRTKTWVVHSFGDVANTQDRGAEGTDVRGHGIVRVQVKSGRASLASSSAVGEGKVVDVAVTALYLTHTMRPYFKDRLFNAPTTTTNSRAATPSTGIQTPESESPSRMRRAAIAAAKGLPPRMSNLREDLISLPSTPLAVGLFSGMAFAVSYVLNGSEKAQVTNLIQRNGGFILESGFDELFDVPHLNERPSTPSKKSPVKNAQAQQSETVGLHLKPAYEDFGFVALIADRHSRRAKYFQALALGLPTLSGRWITDSLNASKNRSLDGSEATPLTWSKYLLPAGESTYLGGAVRSRTLTAYSVKEVKLSETIRHRPILLDGEGVLLCPPKKGKGASEKFKTFAFLALALGAARVKRVSELGEAKELLTREKGRWRWVYVDGDVGQASKVLFGKGCGGGGGKKRKRAEEGEREKVGASGMAAGDGNVRVVNDEFVIQSLILGDLVE